MLTHDFCFPELFNFTFLLISCISLSCHFSHLGRGLNSFMLENFCLSSLPNLYHILAGNDSQLAHIFCVSELCKHCCLSSDAKCRYGEDEGSLNFLPLRRSSSMFPDFCRKTFWGKNSFFWMPGNVLSSVT